MIAWDSVRVKITSDSCIQTSRHFRSILIRIIINVELLRLRLFEIDATESDANSGARISRYYDDNPYSANDLIGKLLHVPSHAIISAP